MFLIWTYQEKHIFYSNFFQIQFLALAQCSFESACQAEYFGGGWLVHRPPLLEENKYCGKGNHTVTQ